MTARVPRNSFVLNSNNKQRFRIFYPTIGFIEIALARRGGLGYCLYSTHSYVPKHRRNYGAPEIVNDGVTIAREIILRNPEENVGARLIQEVASKSDSKTGDGTTTSTIMTQAIVNGGIRAVTT